MARAAEADETRDADRFALSHLQSVEAENGWYYNNRFLGKGGNGTAFLVTASSGPYFGLQLVLKVFHRISRPNRRQAFLDEVRLLRDLNHPAIIQIYDEGEFRTGQATYPFAIVEYVPHTVRQLLDSPLDRLRAVRIAMNCLSALQAIHELELGLTRFRGPIRVKRSGFMKGVDDGQDGQTLPARVQTGSRPAGALLRRKVCRLKDSPRLGRLHRDAPQVGQPG